MSEAAAQALSPAVRERIYRRNFVFFLIDTLLFTGAMNIISPTTVIPDFVRNLTSSEILIGLCGSLFTIGFTLPQLLVARYIVRYERKKWWFVGPNIPVRSMILLFALLTFWLGAGQPQLILIAFFICYSLAAFGDGLVGVPWADLAATSMDHRWRARMFGIATVIIGSLMLLVSPLIGVILSEQGPAFPNNYALLFGIAGLMFALSTVPCIFIQELPGAKAVQKAPPFREFLPALGRLLRDDGPFRAYIAVRIGTNLFLMAAPFYIGYATVELGLSSEVAVPTLLAMQTAGSLTGALVYTWLGERNNLLYIRLALGAAALLPISALLAGVVGPLPLYIGFLVSGLANSSNLFASFLNWVVGYAQPDQRPLYVGLSNTITALVSLVAPVIGGTIAQQFGYRPLFVLSLVMALSTLFITVRFLRAKPQERAVVMTAGTS